MLNGATAGIGLVHALLLRPALCRRQHRVHDRVLAPRADRRARHQLDAAAHRRPRQRARSADVRAPRLQRRERCASGWSTGSIRRTSCASRPMPMRAISPISSRRARFRVIKRQLYDVPFQTLAEATIDANREMDDRRCAAAIFAKAWRASWRSGRRGLRGSEWRLSGQARLRPAGLRRGHRLRLRAIDCRGLAQPKPRSQRRLVEPGGIEPPTSSLRTTRSPS